MSSYAGDPRLMNSRFAGVDMYGTAFKKGDEILYYPNQPRGKNTICGEKAQQEYRDFCAAVQDEDFYNGQY